MTAQAIDGEVVVMGPNAMAAALTPAAAEESARRLLEAAREATAQSRDAAPADG